MNANILIRTTHDYCFVTVHGGGRADVEDAVKEAETVLLAPMAEGVTEVEVEVVDGNDITRFHGVIREDDKFAVVVMSDKEDSEVNGYRTLDHAVRAATVDMMAGFGIRLVDLHGAEEVA